MTKALTDVFPLTFFCLGLHLDSFVQRWQIWDFFYPQFPSSFFLGYQTKKADLISHADHTYQLIVPNTALFLFPLMKSHLVGGTLCFACQSKKRRRKRGSYLKLYIEYQYKTEYLPEKLILRKLKIQLEIEGGKDNSHWEIGDGIVFCFVFYLLSYFQISTKNLPAYNFSK